VDYFHKIQPLIGDAAVILADNVLFRGYVRSAAKPPRRYKTIVKRLREYIDLVSAPPFTTEILEHGDGLAVTRRISIHDQKA
jgi:predicted O-methyltransferase YrrM